MPSPQSIPFAPSLPNTVNSANCAYWLPSSYTDNDFDGLFEDEQDTNISCSNSNNGNHNISSTKHPPSTLHQQYLGLNNTQYSSPISVSDVPIGFNVAGELLKRRLPMQQLEFQQHLSQQQVQQRQGIDAKLQSFPQSQKCPDNRKRNFDNAAVYITTPLLSSLFPNPVSSLTVSSSCKDYNDCNDPAKANIGTSGCYISSQLNQSIQYGAGFAIISGNNNGQASKRQAVRKKRSLDSDNNNLTAQKCKKEGIQTSQMKHVSNTPAPPLSIDTAVAGNESRLSPLSPMKSTSGTPASKKTMYKYRKVVASELPSKIKTPTNKNEESFHQSPFEIFNQILTSRSYSTKTIPSMSNSSPYYSLPSLLQKASFGTTVLKAVGSGDTKTTRKMLLCGLSRNPCNSFGDSLLNYVCKRGQNDMFQTFMECGASLLVVDSFGRTPLHYACWSAKCNFDIILYILSTKIDMLRVEDKYGKTPLEYIAPRKLSEWRDFLMKNQDKFWPIGCEQQNFHHQQDNQLSEEVLPKKDNFLPDPEDALPEHLALLLSSGKISIEEVEKMRMTGRKGL